MYADTFREGVENIPNKMLQESQLSLTVRVWPYPNFVTAIRKTERSSPIYLAVLTKYQRVNDRRRELQHQFRALHSYDTMRQDSLTWTKKLMVWSAPSAYSSTGDQKQTKKFMYCMFKRTKANKRQCPLSTVQVKEPWRQSKWNQRYSRGKNVRNKQAPGVRGRGSDREELNADT